MRQLYAGKTLELGLELSEGSRTLIIIDLSCQICVIVAQR